MLERGGSQIGGKRPQTRYSGEFQTFDRDEIASLTRHARDEQDATLYLAAAYTALRQGELLALRWRDLDFAAVRRAWSQAAKTEKSPKSGKVRSVPLVTELIAPLDGLSRREHFTGDDDLVFSNETGGHLDAWALRRRYAATLKRAGLRRITFHSLRHAFGSTAVRAFPLSDVPSDARPLARHHDHALRPPPVRHRRRRPAVERVP
jgi:integrase